MGVSGITGASSYQAANQVQPVADAVVVEKATDAEVTDTVVKKSVAATPEKPAKQSGESTYADEQMELSQEKIKKAVETINKQLSNTECQYGFHEKTNRVTLKIVDKETDKVIKEFPPEKTLEMIAKAWELAGILVDEKL